MAAVIEAGTNWTMHYGDCLDVMRGIDCVDHVITDPPFDAKTHAGALTVASSRVTSGADSVGVGFGELVDVAGLTVALLKRSSRWVVSFCSVEMIGAYAAASGKSWVRSGIWDKIAPSPQITGDRPGQAVEAIAIMHRPGRKRWNRGGGAGIWRHLSPKGDDRPEHPTPKPIPLMLDLVADFTDPGETILDPFAGSGTTGVAAIRLGRKFIGIEKDPKYFALAVERLRAEESGSTLRAHRAGQEPLFK